MTRAQVRILLLILRRIRQASCGKCWADPGRRCRRMAWSPGQCLWVPTKRTQFGVHGSRTLRAFAKGVLAIDLPSGIVERAARYEEVRR